jgi:hypothetical protein
MRRLLPLLALLLAAVAGGQTDTFRLFRGPAAYLPACDSSRYGEPAYETDAHIYVICSYSDTWDQFWPQSSLDTFRLFRGPSTLLPSCDSTRYGQPAYETDTHAYVICSTADSWDVFMPADPATMHYKGAWDSGASYVIADVVTDGGSVYVCIAPNSATEPPSASYWTPVGGAGSTVASGITYAATPTPWAFTTPTPGTVQSALDKIASWIGLYQAPTPAPTATPIPAVPTPSPQPTASPIPAPTVPAAGDIGYLATPTPWAFTTPTPSTAQGAIDKIAAWIGAYTVPTAAPTASPIPPPTVPPSSAIGYLATPTPWSFTTPTPSTAQGALDKIAAWIGAYQTPSPQPTASPIPAPTVPPSSAVGYLATPTPWAFTTPTPSTVQGAVDKLAAWVGAYAVPTAAYTPTPELPVVAAPGNGAYWGVSMASQTAGGALGAGDVVYFKSTDSKWYQAKADAVGTSGSVLLGICPAAISSGATGTILIFGTMGKTGWSLTTGSVYYVSPSTAGGITVTVPSTAGQQVRVVGVALSATVMFFHPSSDWGQI